MSWEERVNEISGAAQVDYNSDLTLLLRRPNHTELKSESQ